MELCSGRLKTSEDEMQLVQLLYALQQDRLQLQLPYHLEEQKQAGPLQQFIQHVNALKILQFHLEKKRPNIASDLVKIETFNLF